MIHYGFEGTSRSAWWWRHFCQNLLASVSRSLLASLWSIPIVRLALFSLCFSFLLLFSPLLGIEAVQAQTGCEQTSEGCTPTPTLSVTPTPGETWVPLFPSSTPRPTISNTCPIGQPVGWGTVTPDPNWLWNCSMCVTPDRRTTDVPTATPLACYSGTATAVAGGPNPADGLPDDGGVGTWCGLCPSDPNCQARPSATPTITLTPTITPTPYNTFYWKDFRSLAVKAVGAATAEGPWINVPEYDPATGAKLWGIIKIARKYACSTSNSASVQNRRLVTGVWLTTITTCDKTLTAGKLQTSYPAGAYEFMKLKYPDVSIVSTTRQDMLDDADFSVYISGGTSYSVTGEDYLDALYYGLSPDQLTPTPTVGPSPTATTPAGYCGVVPPLTTPEPPIELPYPKVGHKSCVQIGGFTIGLGWIASISQLVGWPSPADIVVPGANICMQAIQFGDLELFGLKISLDVLAFVMAAVAAIRIFLRS